MYYLVLFLVKNCIALVSDVDNRGDCAYVGAEYMGNLCSRFCCKPETVLKNCLTANYHLCFSVSISIYSCMYLFNRCIYTHVYILFNLK